MRDRPPGTLRVLRLLAKNAVLRMVRAAVINKQKRQPRPESRTAGTSRRARKATPRKGGAGLLWLMVLMVPLFLFQSIIISGQAVHRLGAVAEARWQIQEQEPVPGPSIDYPEEVVDESSQEPLMGGRSAGRVSRSSFFLARERNWSRPEGRELFVQCGTLLLLTLLLILLAIGFGGANANLAGGEWTQAWLMTFPIATRSLVLARALEYSLVQVFPWVTLFPLTYQLLRVLGQPWALPLAVAGTLATTFVTGSVRLWAETWLRLRFSLRALRNIQGACTLFSLVLLATLFGIAFGTTIPDWFLALGGAIPSPATLLPSAWPLAVSGPGLPAAGFGVVLAGTMFMVAVGSTSRLLAHGAMRTGGVDSGARGRSRTWQRARQLGIAGKDLALLMRDRTFLVQTVFVPVFVIGLQLIVNPGLGHVRGHGVTMLAYGIGLYSLIGGCFQVLAAEGRALWMLYSLPMSIGEVLRKKTRIWATMAVIFGWTALAAFGLRSGAIDPIALGADALLVGFGLWCAAHIAAGISVIGCNPNADHVPRQPKARFVYLYFMLSGTYFIALGWATLAQGLATGLVFGTIAYAIWQLACDRLPWLLDPIDEPRRSLALLDGGAAVLMFFLLQTLFVFLLSGRGGMSEHNIITISFATAGTLTVVLFLIMLKRRSVDLGTSLGLRAKGGIQVLRELSLGVAAGGMLGLFGLGYIDLIRNQGWFDLPDETSGEHLRMLWLAVLLAPVIEEVLFRGLVFGGLVRSVRWPLAILWSSALFAVMHPTASWMPVFVMGAVAALIFHRTRFLPAAILVHATYNFIILWFR